MTRPIRSACTVGAEIIATLMHAPRSWPEVIEQVGLSNPSSDKWLAELRASGVIHILRYERRTKHGRHARIYALQSKPFALPDADEPAVSRLEGRTSSVFALGDAA